MSKLGGSLKGVMYEFSPSDKIICNVGGRVGSYEWKKVDVLSVIIDADSDVLGFRTFADGRWVVDIIEVNHIIWPSKLEFTANGAPSWYTNDQRTFRIKYHVSGGLIKHVTGTFIDIDDLPGVIRCMKVDRVLNQTGE